MYLLRTLATQFLVLFMQKNNRKQETLIMVNVEADVLCGKYLSDLANKTTLFVPWLMVISHH